MTSHEGLQLQVPKACPDRDSSLQIGCFMQGSRRESKGPAVAQRIAWATLPRVG